MTASLELKWGNIKGWDGFMRGTPAGDALQAYLNSRTAIGCMHRQTDEQRKLICDVIDAIDGEIVDDWSGDKMTKEEAKRYVMDYGR